MKERKSGVRPRPIVDEDTVDNQQTENVNEQTEKEVETQESTDDYWMKQIDEELMDQSKDKPRKTRREKRRQRKEYQGTKLLNIDGKQLNSYN